MYAKRSNYSNRNISAKTSTKISSSKKSQYSFRTFSKATDFSSTSEDLSFGSVEFLTRHNVSELTDDDVEEVKALCNSAVTQIYNVTDPFIPIHSCYCSIKLTTSTNKIVGAMCMEEFPNVPALPPVGWSNWAASLYNIKDLTSFNSLWVHLVVYDKRYKSTFLYPMLNWVFHESMVKTYCLFTIPRGCHELVKYLDGVSSIVLPENYTDPMKIQTIRLCVRQDFITNYKIRRAVEEDNDDLVPLIHEFSPRFVELYGEYYVAEIITRHPDVGRKIIVAELDGEAVSVLCLNPNVNYDQLNECFDLHVFTGLYKMETAYQQARPPKDDKSEESSQNSLGNVIKSQHSKSSIKIESNYNSSYYTTHNPEETVVPTENMAVVSTYSVLDKLDQLTLEHSSNSFVMDKFPSDSTLQLNEDSVSGLTSGTNDLPFVGVPNAFAIEILASQAKHKQSLPLLIISCFECFPERDYCLLMLPHDADFSSILSYFVRVQPRMQSQHPHELYVCHRAQLSHLRVRRAFKYDSEAVYNFIKLLENPGLIKQNFDDYLAGKSKVMTFLAHSGGRYANPTPVGLAQVACVTDLTCIKTKYALSRRTDFRRDSDYTFGYLLSFCLSPLFKRHLKFFMRELHRKSTFLTIFYGLNRYDEMEYRVRPTSIAIHEMWLVPPRKNKLTKKGDTDYPEEPFALFISMPKLMSKPLIEVNHRIVVIGASITALSFLEALLDNQLNEQLIVFNNVILVSTNGLSTNGNKNPILNTLISTRSSIDVAYLEKIALQIKVNVVSGTLLGINRRNKCVYIDKKVVLPYEYLFLMSGLQYGVPRKKEIKDYTSLRLPTTCFTINNEKDGERALERLEQLLKDNGTKPYDIVVYGYSKDCLCCISALIEFGIPAKYIIWVLPNLNPNSHDFLFQHGDVYETVMNTTMILGVQIHNGYRLIDWKSRPLTLKFESLTRYLFLVPLCAFIYGEKSVNFSMFKAIYESGLVFDGRLVIDAECRTNDPFIFAAGPLTKYTRKMWADYLAHVYFNSEEIGAYLGGKIRAMLLPFKEKLKSRFDFTKSCYEESKYPVKLFKMPLMIYCKLPGGLYYLQVCKPGPKIPLETDMSDTDYGSVLSTGSCTKLKLQGFFRLHLNVYRSVETITCLSMQKFDYHKLSQLWGKHEALLNNLVRRFEAFYITDLFEYFKKPWCTALFLDDFPYLESAIMKVMTSLTHVPNQSPLEDLCRLYKANGYQPLSHEERSEINSKFNESEYEFKIQQLVMDYIRDNLSILDMYAHPIIVNYVLSGYEDSPMFKQI